MVFICKIISRNFNLYYYHFILLHFLLSRLFPRKSHYQLVWYGRCAGLGAACRAAGRQHDTRHFTAVAGRRLSRHYASLRPRDRRCMNRTFQTIEPMMCSRFRDGDGRFDSYSPSNSGNTIEMPSVIHTIPGVKSEKAIATAVAWVSVLWMPGVCS